jgi:hypothetical protein
LEAEINKIINSKTKKIIIMKITKLKLEDFNLEKLTKNHQKEVFGGDGGGGGEEPIDPGKGTGKGGNG